MKWDHYDCKIPEFFLSAIEYGDYEGLTDKECIQLNDFLASLPPEGSWEYGEETYFSWTNDVTDLGSTVIDAKYWCRI